ncbi:Smr/MutS family protein [Sphingomonas sp. PAMC 26605]|uniref:Smr/MutS family protein n=1 Tax=Sphingomonas sp. PAMC 26605 TaxID=1112214 RepID=UPI00026CD6C0|nr:Smr/MutS family protein [Sphingomonas sp. PAMC 26605]
MAGVRPLRAVAPVAKAVPVAPPAERRPAAPVRSPEKPMPSFEALLGKGTLGSVLPAGRKRVAIAAPPKPPGNTLDGSWDRQLSRGLVSPDRTIDLHGHTLHSAYDLLDAALDSAIRAGDRVILLVTGKPPRPASERPHARGAIRAATGDWLAGSRHSAAIAAVRGAHPRHGGAGALYIVLKRLRVAQNS